MISQLHARKKQLEVSLIANRRAYLAAESSLPPCMVEMPKHYIPGPESLIRRILTATRLLRVDHGLSSSDWVYCPSMQPVHCRKAKLAVTIHDSVSFESSDILGEPISRRKRAKDQLLLKRSIERASLLCFVSEHLRARLAQIAPDIRGKKSVIVGNASSDAFFAPISEKDQAILSAFHLKDRRYVVACGDMVYKKGADVLVHLANALKAKQSDLEIAVAGRKRDFQICTDTDISSTNLRLLGYVPADQLAVLLRNSVALVHPSRYESFGIPSVEAMAAGTPVICSNVFALPEVVGDAGLYFDLNSPDELVEQVLKVSEETSLREKLIAKGKMRARQFTWDQCANRLIEAMRAT